MKWIGRQFRKLVRLVVITVTLTVVIVLLDALLSPEAMHLPSGRATTHKVYRDATHPSRLVLPFTSPRTE